MNKTIFDKFEQINAVNLYLNEHKSGKEISDLVGVKNHGSIFDYLKSKGVTLRSRKRRENTREIPIIGTKYGQWTVISDQVKSGTNRHLLWLCQCSCGHIEWKTASLLKSGRIKACRKCAALTVNNGSNIVKIESVISNKFNQIKSSKDKRKKVSKLPFTITVEDIQNLYNKSHFCALSGLDLSVKPFESVNNQNLSVDRIDSNKGYEPDNIQLVDKRINMMKQSLSNQEFIDLCCKVAEYHGYSKCG